MKFAELGVVAHANGNETIRLIDKFIKLCVVLNAVFIYL